VNSFFVIDVGNTSTKWALVTHDRISKPIEIPTDQFLNGKGHLKLNLHKIPFAKGAIICSVVPKVVPGIKRALKSFGISHPCVVSHEMNLGIGIRYPMPQTIGADRLVNSVAAVHLYGSPAIVVDFGTAVTFDVISPENEYLGGVIAPGLRAMTNYLYEQTALLPQISLKEPKFAVGKNTVEAMRVGAVIGYRGLIREILYSIAKEMKLKLNRKLFSKEGVKVIATGGHSSLIASKVPEIHHIDPQLTLKGLRILFNKTLVEK
jgi:type III pantothenate kinase